ncbi:MAG: hypothetical protein ACOC9Y_02595 [Chloroflexota bacterium]
MRVTVAGPAKEWTEVVRNGLSRSLGARVVTCMGDVTEVMGSSGNDVVVIHYALLSRLSHRDVRRLVRGVGEAFIVADAPHDPSVLCCLIEDGVSAFTLEGEDDRRLVQVTELALDGVMLMSATTLEQLRRFNEGPASECSSLDILGP